MFLYRDIDMAEFLCSDAQVQDAHPNTVYDLVANICHDGQPGTYVLELLCIRALVY